MDERDRAGPGHYLFVLDRGSGRDGRVLFWVPRAQPPGVFGGRIYDFFLFQHEGNGVVGLVLGGIGRYGSRLALWTGLDPLLAGPEEVEGTRREGVISGFKSSGVVGGTGEAKGPTLAGWHHDLFSLFSFLHVAPTSGERENGHLGIALGGAGRFYTPSPRPGASPSLSVPRCIPQTRHGGFHQFPSGGALPQGLGPRPALSRPKSQRRSVSAPRTSQSDSRKTTAGIVWRPGGWCGTREGLGLARPRPTTGAVGPRLLQLPTVRGATKNETHVVVAAWLERLREVIAAARSNRIESICRRSARVETRI